MFEEEINLTDSRYTERANLDYAVMKTRDEVIKLEEHPTTEYEYQQALENFQYYFGLLNKKCSWRG